MPMKATHCRLRWQQCCWDVGTILLQLVGATNTPERTERFYYRLTCFLLQLALLRNNGSGSGGLYACLCPRRARLRRQASHSHSSSSFPPPHNNTTNRRPRPTSSCLVLPPPPTSASLPPSSFSWCWAARKPSPPLLLPAAGRALAWWREVLLLLLLLVPMRPLASPRSSSARRPLRRVIWTYVF